MVILTITTNFNLLSTISTPILFVYRKLTNSPNPFIGYFFNLTCNLYAKQGVGILIRKNIPYNPIQFNSTTCALRIEILSQSNVTIFNTYIPPCKVSASLFPFCKWSVKDSLYGSDHIPILTEVHTRSNPTNTLRIPKFIIHKANWELYRTKCNLFFW